MAFSGGATFFDGQGHFFVSVSKTPSIYSFAVLKQHHFVVQPHTLFLSVAHKP